MHITVQIHKQTLDLNLPVKNTTEKNPLLLGIYACLCTQMTLNPGFSEKTDKWAKILKIPLYIWIVMTAALKHLGESVTIIAVGRSEDCMRKLSCQATVISSSVIFRRFHKTNLSSTLWPGVCRSVCAGESSAKVVRWWIQLTFVWNGDIGFTARQRGITCRMWDRPLRKKHTSMFMEAIKYFKPIIFMSNIVNTSSIRNCSM